jgi:hypothetical protein
MTEQEQAAILLQVGFGSPGPAFFVNKDQITIRKEVFKKHFTASNLIEKNKKEHREFPRRDGYHIIERKRSGKFELLLMERGNVEFEFEFKNKEELVSYLVDRIYSMLGLPD